MKKIKTPLAIASIITTVILLGSLATGTTGCSTTTTNGTNAPTTVTTGLNPAALAQIDQAVSNIIAAAPAAIADAQAISAIAHGTNK